MLRAALVAGIAGLLSVVTPSLASAHARAGDTDVRPAKTAAPTSPIPLERTSWKAIELGGRPVAPARRGLEPHLVFDKGRLTGADGCNPVKGLYQTMGPVIKIANVSSGIACLGGTESGRALRKALDSAHVFRIREERLELFDGSGTVLARFAAPHANVSPSVAAPALVRTSWKFVKFQGSDGMTLTADKPASYTLVFGGDGRLSATIGCHRARSTWQASGRSELQFGALALQGSPCSSGKLHDHLITHLGRVRSYTVRDGHLYLSLMGDAGVYEYERAK